MKHQSRDIHNFQAKCWSLVNTDAHDRFFEFWSFSGSRRNVRGIWLRNEHTFRRNLVRGHIGKHELLRRWDFSIFFHLLELTLTVKSRTLFNDNVIDVILLDVVANLMLRINVEGSPKAADVITLYTVTTERYWVKHRKESPKRGRDAQSLRLCDIVLCSCATCMQM